MSKLFEILAWLFFALVLLIPDSLVRPGFDPQISRIGLVCFAVFFMAASIKYGETE